MGRILSLLSALILTLLICTQGQSSVASTSKKCLTVSWFRCSRRSEHKKSAGPVGLTLLATRLQAFFYPDFHFCEMDSP